MAVVTSAVVGTVATVGSAVNQRNAAKRAAGQQERAADNAIALQRDTRDLARQDLSPYNQMGLRAMSRLEQLAGGVTPNTNNRQPSRTPLGLDLTGIRRSSRTPARDKDSFLRQARISRRDKDSYRQAQSPVGNTRDYREGVTLNPNYQSNVQDFNRSGEFNANLQDLDANTEFIPAQRPQRTLRTDFTREPRRTYDDAASRADQTFRDASDVVADQVSSRAAARGKLGSGNTLSDLFRENVMLREGLTQSEFDRNRSLEDRDRLNLAQDEAIFANNLNRNLAATASDRQGTALDAQIAADNFGRQLSQADFNRTNEMARAGIFGDNYNRALAGAGFNRDNDQVRERTFNNNFARNLDLAELNRQEAILRDSLKGADFNRNLSLVNLGQASAAGQAGTAERTGNSIANLYTQRGNATAAGTIGAANATSNFLDELARVSGRIYGANV